MDWLRSHWKLVVVLTIIAAIGIQVFEPDYNKLQTAKDAAAFRHTLGDTTARATGATVCDMTFALGYSLLALAMCVIAGRSRLAMVGAGLALTGGLMDELENVALLRNVARHRHIGNGAIDAMQLPGTIKWIGSPGFILLIALIVTRRWRAPS